MSEVSVSGSHAASAPESPEAVIAALQAVIVELRARVADLERQLGLNSGNSGKPPSSDGLKKKPARVSSLRGRSGKKPGGQPGHPGNTLRRSENPGATVNHFPETCAGCGAALSEATANGHTARQVFDLPEPQPLLVTEHRAHACRCTACGSQTRADFPEGVSAPVQYGPRIAAIVLYLLHYQLLPEKRLAVLMADLFGVRLVTATIAGMSRSCAARFQGFATAVRDHVVAAPVKHMDETGFRIGGKTQWLHIASTIWLTFYRTSPKRGGLLENVQGIVVHDHWKPYYTLKGVLHALCNAHHLRELQALVEIEKEDWAPRMQRLLRRAKSMLLATATPVQLHPVEAWDLLHILSHGNDGVLGGWTQSSPWFRASHCLDIATGVEAVPSADDRAGWQYVMDPLPSRFEDAAFDRIRRNLDANDTRWQFNPESLDKLSPAIRRVQLRNSLLPNYGEAYNPLLRCIVRRTRAYLEATINPATGSYFLPKVSVKLFGENDDDALVLGGYLREAYQEAELFSQLLQKRVKGAGFFKTLLLRRLGSSMEAGRRTIGKLLGADPDAFDDEEDDDAEEEAIVTVGRPALGASEFKDFTVEEIASLQRCLKLLKEGGNNDPKLDALIGYLLGTQPGTDRNWLDLGCILFSQYYDTVRWVGDELSKRTEFEGVDIGLYAGSNRSGFWRQGKFQRCDRNILKGRVRSGDMKLLLGTDAASEGLNLQRLGTLINIDLPWNPTRLEQRKGRIQRIGQARSEICIANLRYRDSVEDRVHQVLADRLEAIHGLFGQIPDTLEDVWVQVALNDEQAANQLIDRTTATRNPFDVKYSRVEDADWETSPLVLDPMSVKEQLSIGW